MTSLQAKSSHTRRREIGSKDKQGETHQRSDRLTDAVERSDTKACHTMNQRSTNKEVEPRNDVRHRF
jgi:hypothetical protein